MKRTAALRPDADRGRTVRRALAALGFLLALSALTVLAGRPLTEIVRDPARFRAFAAGSGAWGRIAFLGMMVLQVVVAFIPGEPFEIAAGLAFGAVEGTALCMLGTLIGGTAVFLFVRKYGAPLVCAFFPMERIRKAPLLAEPRRLGALAFLLFFIPGTPKDLLTYCVGLTDMRLRTWICITSLARFPSIVTSTIGGDALGLGDFTFAAVVFGATLAISLAGFLFYRARERALDAE